IPSALFTAEGEPAKAALETYYSENRADYIQPERRTLRFAVFDADNLTDDVAPSSAEIAARYEENKAEYAARESRDVTFFTVPTEESARAIIAQIRAGKSLEAAARDAGFNTTTVTDRDREQFASRASFGAAQAVFDAGQGEIAEPAQSTLGWQVARVDRINRTPERTLAQVSDEISQQLTEEKRAAALAELSARIEEEVDQGTSLTEIAETFDLTLEESPPLLADGRVFGDPRTQPNQALRPILETAFALDESQPQLDVLVPGQQFLVYDVTSITESSAPPLAEIRERVVTDYKLAQASKTARETAQRVLEKARGQGSLDTALRGEEKDLPPADEVTLSRAELQQLRQRGGGVPPAFALLFSMAEGTVKLLEAPGNQGWILIALDDITADEIEDGSPLVERTRQQLAQSLRSEYSDQLTKAMRAEVGVEINETALEAVTKQLVGDN
ncbi:MAG: peptidyl-prolyl cis-trans isomerase, partial [Erythrobacter sp.]|nr:peptidyl-prolyl cis-trans isomerase [Erythrobacter sp.]